MAVQGAKVRIARLFQKTSRNDRTYFVGRLGNARALMFRDEHSEASDPEWHLFVQEIPEADGERPSRPASTWQDGGGPRQRHWQAEQPSPGAAAASRARQQAHAAAVEAQAPATTPAGEGGLNDRVDDIFALPEDRNGGRKG